MTKVNIAKKILLVLFLVIFLIALIYTATHKVFFAEIELPKYCLYENSKYAKFTVVVKNGVVTQTVKCNSVIAERESVKIAYRSKVYWGYRGQEPFPSTYGYGIDSPKARIFSVDPHKFVRGFYMGDKDFPIHIMIFNQADEKISEEYYSVEEKQWFRINGN